MAEAAVQVGVTVAGRAERARVVRAFTAGVTGPGHPCGADAALPGSGLSGSGLWHSRPEVPGETVTVRAGDVASFDGGTRSIWTFTEPFKKFTVISG